MWHDLDILGTAMVAGKLDSFSALVGEIVSSPLAPRFAKDVLEKATGRNKALQQLALPEYEGYAGQATRKDIRLHRLNQSTARMTQLSG